MPESFSELVARMNASAFIANPDPTANGGLKMAREFKLAKGKTYAFKPANAGAQVSRYAWDEFFNGKLILIERSDVDADNNLLKGPDGKPVAKRDFEVDVQAMIGKIKHAARKRYKVVQIGRHDADGSRLKDALVLQARDMDKDERAAEDVLRAEEREKNKEIRKQRKVKEAAKKQAAADGAAQAPAADGAAAPAPQLTDGAAAPAPAATAS